MNIKYTRHGETRTQQRGISKRDILTVLEYGTPIDDGTVLLRRQDVAREVGRLKREIQALECNKDRKIVLADDEVITAYRSRRADQRRAFRISRTKGYRT